MFISLVAASWSTSAISQTIFVSGIYVQCASADASLRLIQSDAGKIGKHYAPLTSTEGRIAKSFADRMFSHAASDVGEIHAAYSGEPDANGDQMKKEGVWPAQAFRLRTGQCTTSAPHSLGREGSSAFAYVPVTCSSGLSEWTSIRLGVEFRDGLIVSHCANLGSFASVALPPTRKD